MARVQKMMGRTKNSNALPASRRRVIFGEKRYRRRFRTMSATGTKAMMKIPSQMAE
jgi:hypothetical protein